MGQGLGTTFGPVIVSVLNGLPPAALLSPLMGWDVVTAADGKGQEASLPSPRLPDEGSYCTQTQLLPPAWLSCGPSCLASVLRSVCGGFGLFPSRFDAFLSRQELRVICKGCCFSLALPCSLSKMTNRTGDRVSIS